jgi:hypothetical protein
MKIDEDGQRLTMIYDPKEKRVTVALGDPNDARDQKLMSFNKERLGEVKEWIGMINKIN